MTALGWACTTNRSFAFDPATLDAVVVSHAHLDHTGNLPTLVDHDKAEATFENGILTITLPKAEEVKPKSIKIAAHGVIEGKS